MKSESRRRIPFGIRAGVPNPFNRMGGFRHMGSAAKKTFILRFIPFWSRAFAGSCHKIYGLLWAYWLYFKLCPWLENQMTSTATTPGIEVWRTMWPTLFLSFLTMVIHGSTFALARKYPTTYDVIAFLFSAHIIIVAFLWGLFAGNSMVNAISSFIIPSGTGLYNPTTDPMPNRFVACFFITCILFVIACMYYPLKMLAEKEMTFESAKYPNMHTLTKKNDGIVAHVAGAPATDVDAVPFVSEAHPNMEEENEPLRRVGGDADSIAHNPVGKPESDAVPFAFYEMFRTIAGLVAGTFLGQIWIPVFANNMFYAVNPNIPFTANVYERLLGVLFVSLIVHMIWYFVSWRSVDGGLLRRAYTHTASCLNFACVYAAALWLYDAPTLALASQYNLSASNRSITAPTDIGTYPTAYSGETFTALMLTIIVVQAGMHGLPWLVNKFRRSGGAKSMLHQPRAAFPTKSNIHDFVWELFMFPYIFMWAQVLINQWAPWMGDGFGNAEPMGYVTLSALTVSAMIVLVTFCVAWWDAAFDETDTNKPVLSVSASATV